jgi:hypothetical protein
MFSDKFFLLHYFNLLSVEEDKASLKCPIKLTLRIGLIEVIFNVENTPFRTLLWVV